MFSKNQQLSKSICSCSDECESYCIFEYDIKPKREYVYYPIYPMNNNKNSSWKISKTFVNLKFKIASIVNFSEYPRYKYNICINGGAAYICAHKSYYNKSDECLYLDFTCAKLSYSIEYLSNNIKHTLNGKIRKIDEFNKVITFDVYVQ